MKIEQAVRITDVQLIDYLEQHGISLAVAHRYLKQLNIYHNKTKVSTVVLAQRHDNDGYYILNSPFDKSFSKDESPTFIRGKRNTREGIHIFKDALDFLSAVMQNGNGEPLKCDSFIANSSRCLELVPVYMRQYGYRSAFTWMDNTDIGKQATRSLAEFFKTEEGLEHLPMNFLYAPHDNVNTWHRAELGLSD